MVLMDAPNHSLSAALSAALAAADLTEPALFTPGQRVLYGEFTATVVGHDCEGMWNVRVPGGVTCVSGAHLRAI